MKGFLARIATWLGNGVTECHEVPRPLFKNFRFQATRLIQGGQILPALSVAQSDSASVF